MTECRYNGNCCVMYHRPFDSDDLPCDGYDVDICSLYKPMPDVKALKGLADEFEKGAKAAREHKWNNERFGVMGRALADEYEANARRIRRSLGEVE